MQQDVNPQNLNNQVGLNSPDAVLAEYGLKRSPQWAEVEQAFLNQHNQKCAMCSITGKGLVQVHHIAPFHYISSPNIQRGDLEFNPQNLIPLCQGPGTNNHHILIGHLGDFQYFNEEVRADMIGPWKDLIPADQLKQLADWLARNRNHFPLVNAMTQQDITAFIALLVTWYGPKPQESVDALIEQWYGFKPRSNGRAGAPDVSTSAPASNTGGN
jgi:5-methylcytosine-specific restriction endonuclease McrA